MADERDCEPNSDFVECAECGGEFYKGDLSPEGRCVDCEEMLDDLFKDEDA